MFRRFLLLSIFALLLLPQPARAKNYSKLIKTIQSDSSYKVRARGLQLLTKRLKRTPRPIPKDAQKIVQHAALEDPHYLVRGLACHAIGQLKLSQLAPVLVLAQKDQHAFVRAQAEQAYKQLGLKKLPDSSRGVLLASVQTFPGQDQQDPLLGFLLNHIQGILKKTGVGTFTEAQQAGIRGHELQGSYQLKADSGQKMEVQVKVAVLTYPEKNLKYLFTAKAKAPFSASGEELMKKRLLVAAANKAMQDALAQLKGGKR